MVASGSRTMIAGSLSSYIAGLHQSCRFSQSSDPRRSCVGTGPVFVATGVGSRAHWEDDRGTYAFADDSCISAKHDVPKNRRHAVITILEAMMREVPYLC